MNFLRKHWFDMGGLLLAGLVIFICFSYASLSSYQLIVWLSLGSLWCHQLEEYRIAGTFPGMINRVFYKSSMPDRYPLNPHTAMFINVFVGWGSYLLAALFAEKAIWLGIATMTVSIGNIVAHTTLFNIKGKTFYNPGLATSWLFFAPAAWYFFTIIHTMHLVTMRDYCIGIPLGIVLNVVGVVKTDRLDEEPEYPLRFSRQVPVGGRSENSNHEHSSIKFLTMKTVPFLRLLIAGSFILAAASCGQGDKNKKPAVAPEVNVIVAGQGAVPVYSEYVGQTSGESDIKILPRVQGWITGKYFKDGQKVEKGALLYTIDDLPIRAQLNGYRANIAKAVTVMTNKKSDLERVKPLADMNALSKHDLDAAVADYESAQSEVKVAEAQLADGNIQLGYTRVKAPISGLLGISSVEVGDYVGGSSSGVLNTISATTDIKVLFPISESDYLRFIKRMKSDTAYNHQLPALPVELILGDGAVYNQKGKLTLADRQIDPTTGSLLVEALFPNPQQILRPGQYAKVRFQSDEHKDVIMIPQQAVNQLQDIYQVYVLNDSNKIVPKVVKPGARTGSNWIIEEGLKPGDKVALIGNAFINPKLPVTPKTIHWDYQQNKAN